jgi:hypothetical protein
VSQYFYDRIKKRIENGGLTVHHSRESFMRATNDGEINLLPKLPPDQEAEVFRLQRAYMRTHAATAEVILATDAEIRAAVATGSEQ